MDNPTIPAEESKPAEPVVEVSSQDLLAELTKVRAEKVQIEQEKENYKKAALKAKGYLPNNDPQEGDDLQSVEEVVKKVILEQQSRTKTDEEQKLIEKIAEENRSLKEKIISLQNRSQVSPQASASGTGISDVDKKEHQFTKEQISVLKAKGLDPKKVWENMQRTNNGTSA